MYQNARPVGPSCVLEIMPIPYDMGLQVIGNAKEGRAKLLLSHAFCLTRISARIRRVFRRAWALFRLGGHLALPEICNDSAGPNRNR
jgi:hypothetical protein